jgi:hypothetical protein
MQAGQMQSAAVSLNLALLSFETFTAEHQQPLRPSQANVIPHSWHFTARAIESTLGHPGVYLDEDLPHLG